MPQVRVNSIDLYFESKGTGPPLLLIAGFACDSSIWAKVLPTLARSHQVLVFDNRGVGRTKAPDSPITIHQMADDAAALLDELGIDRAHVAGHSMGGQIALKLALTHPERVQSLQLLATCAQMDARDRIIIESWGELPRLVDPATGIRLSLPWIYTSKFFDLAGVPEQIIDLMLAYPYPASPQGVYHQSRAVSAFDASTRLGEIRCPTLVLVGREDILLPVAKSERLAREIQDAELVIVPDTGHGFLIESPKPVVQAMLNFLKKVGA